MGVDKPLEKSEMVRLGLVGTGPWGQNYIRALTNCTSARLVAICGQQKLFGDSKNAFRMDHGVVIRITVFL